MIFSAAVVMPATSLFAQAAQGFNAEVVAGMDLPMQGRIGAGYLLVRKDLQSSIMQPADLKGRTMEGAVEGSPLGKTQDFWVSQNQVRQKVDVSEMVDASVLADAVPSVGKTSP